MRNHILLAALLVALFLLFGCVGYGSKSASGNDGAVTTTGKTYTISIQNFAFSPAEITIKKGDTIKWINLDSVGHTATSDTGEFDSGLLGNNAQWSRTFNDLGEFTYHCTPHSYMKAKIIVEE